MRRIDLINSVKTINNALIDSNIGEYLYPRSEKADPADAMEAYQKFMRYFDKFGATEKEILEIFNLEGIESNILWTKILVGDNKEIREMSYPYYKGVAFMRDYLPDIVNLLKQSNLEYHEDISKTIVIDTNIENKALIQVILPELNHHASNPDRLIITLQSIQSFYTTMAIILEKDQNDLSVIAIDSGSDKSFDFLGAATVVTAVKELIIELWDRIVFYREKKLQERIDLISNSLPVIEKIKSLEDSGALGPEQCELLRRSIFLGAKNFINAGAILPDFSSHSTHDPRRLMTPESKLLTMPENISNDKLNDEIYIEDSETQTDELSHEEKEILKKLIAKQGSTRKPKKK